MEWSEKCGSECAALFNISSLKKYVACIHVCTPQHVESCQVGTSGSPKFDTSVLYVQGDTKKGELLKNPTKIEEIKKKNYWQKLNYYNLPFKRQ